MGLLGRRRHFLHRSAVALNAPALVVQEGGLDTHTADEGDDLVALATVDDGDGFTTTGVNLYNGASLIGAMVDEGGGEWSYDLTDVVAGEYSYRARRITADGSRYSATWALDVAASAGDPDFIIVDDDDFIQVDGSDFIQVT